MAEDVFSFWNMVEEFQKYKDILDREQEEFRKQLKRDVSASWFFQLDKKMTFQTKWGENSCKNLSKLLFDFCSKFIM